MNPHSRRTIINIVPIIAITVFCLAFFLGNPLFWLLGDPLFVEHCQVKVDNQLDKIIYVTPLQAIGNSYSDILLFRTTGPTVPAFQQRHLQVNAGEQISLIYSCEARISVLYVCTTTQECYVDQAPGKKATIVSLDALFQPDADLQRTVQSLPEHNYTSLINSLLCLGQVTAILVGLYWLRKAQPQINQKRESKQEMMEGGS